METQEVKTPMRDVLLRAVAVLGLIAVLLLGAWGIIQLAVSIPTLFSNVGGGVSTLFTQSAQKEALAVSAPATVASGKSLQVSWDHKNKDGEYSYSISYACQTGLSVKAPLPNGSYQTIACNTAFNFVSADKNMTVIPTATKSAPLALTVSATKLSSGAVTAQGSVSTNVAPLAGQAAAATPAQTQPAKGAVISKGAASTYYAAPVTKALYGYGDLAVRVNSVAPIANGLTVVVFTVENIGTNSVASGWNFNANLPIYIQGNGSYMFASQPQRALYPGDKVVYTLTFSNSNGYTGGYNNGYGYTGAGYYTGTSYYSGTGSYTCTGYGPCFPPSHDPIDYPYGNYNYNYGYSGPVTITVDPQNVVWESNEYNNTAYSQGY